MNNIVLKYIECLKLNRYRKTILSTSPMPILQKKIKIKNGSPASLAHKCYI